LSLALLAGGCAKPTYEMQLAQEMINDAKSAGAMNREDASKNLKNAEAQLAEGKKKMDKLDYSGAKAKFDQAYKSAKKAYELAATEPCTQQPCCVPVSKSKTHIVKKGECLWKIAAKPEYYGDPWLWPLIYDANKTDIEARAKKAGLPAMWDEKGTRNPKVRNRAHWIFPGQQLTVPMDPSAADKNNAWQRTGKPKAYRK
jgi:nucleoid-associated protein YgaU